MNVLLDEGNDAILVRKSLVRPLGLKGNSQTQTLAGISGSSKEVGRFRSERVDLDIITKEGPVTIAATSIPSICVPISGVRWLHMKSRRRHSRWQTCQLQNSEGKYS